MVTGIELSGLVDRLYEAATGGASWSEAIGAIERCLHPCDIGPCIQTPASPVSAPHGMLVVGGSAGTGSSSCGDMTALQAVLGPHLLRAREIRGRLAVAEAMRHQVLDTLDRLGQAVLFVDPLGRPLHQSGTAIVILRAADAVRLEQGMLACAGQDETRKLRRLIVTASTGQGHGGRLTIRRQEARPPLSALVAPLCGPHPFLPVPLATAMVVLNDPLHAAPIDAQHLRELYGLTLAETRTALALLDTIRLQDVADRFGVSLSAVRIHLQRTFEKTGTHRQAELVRLLLAHRMPVCCGPAPGPVALRVGGVDVAAAG